MDLPSIALEARRELGLPELAGASERTTEPLRAMLPAVASTPDPIAATVRGLGSRLRPAGQLLADVANGAAQLTARAGEGASTGGGRDSARALLSAIYVEGAAHGEASMPRAPRTDGNRVDLLVRNAEFVPRLTADLESAQRSITVNQFNWELDGSGAMVADLLERKARSGLDVRVMVDGHGILERGKGVANAMQKRLEDAGVKFVRTGGFQLRGSGFEHRKLITIDDRVAYTGGLGFGAKYDTWTDLMVRMEGPAAAVAATTALAGLRSHARTQDPSLTTRLAALGRTLQQAALGVQELHAGPPRAGAALADARAAVTLLDNRPGVDLAASEAFLRDAAAAKHRFWASSTYVTTGVAIDALKDAARRGVDVKLLVTSLEAGNDRLQVELARTRHADLIKAGVEIYELPTILHAKSWLRDDDVAAVGSMNLSRSSMARAREITARVEDAAFAKRYAAFHEQTRAGAHLVQLSDLGGLPTKALGLLPHVGVEF